MAKKKVVKQRQEHRDMAYEVYRTLKAAIPDGTFLPAVYEGMEYLLADLLMYSLDATQYEDELDHIRDNVITIIRKQMEIRRHVN